MNSTERFDADSNIISSKNSAATERVDMPIVSSQIATGNADNFQQFILDDKTYNVIRQIARSGESDVFEVDENGKRWVLKYYFSNFKPKDDILKKLKLINRQDVIAPLESGYYQDRFWEINEYMTGGTLGDVLPIRDVNRFKELVGKIVDVIQACHQHQIIHRDIKPVNIFFRNSEKKDIVLGDFGISSALQDGSNYTTTTVARTTTYAAPELFTNINNQTTLDNKVDFYALGISLLEMWIGEDPFKDIAPFNIMRIKMEGRVFIPDDIHPDIEKLIKGLITTEPPKRWGYDEVQKWLRHEPVNVYYYTHDVQFSAYEFDSRKGITVSDPKDLAYYMDNDRQKAAQQLYSRSILKWIEPASQDLYSQVHDIVERSYKGDTEASAQAGVTKTIYLLDKDRPFKSFDGTEWHDPESLGHHIEHNATYFRKELAQHTASLYLFLEARGFQDRVAKYRKYYREQSPEKAFNLVILDLHDNKLSFGGQLFDNVNQLTNATSAVQEQLVTAIVNPDSKVSVWLDTTFPNLSANLHNWRALGEFHATTLSYALKTAGFQAAGKEMFTAAEFYNAFKEAPQEFIAGTQPAVVLEQVDYWLKNYQQSSLLPILNEGQFFQSANCTYPVFKVLYTYFLEHHSDPYSTTTNFISSIKQQVSDDLAKLDELAAVTHKVWAACIDSVSKDKAYAMQAVEAAVLKLVTLKKTFPAFAEKLLLLLDAEVDRLIHHDIGALQNNITAFNLYQDSLRKFVSEDIAAVSTASPYYNHWQTEQSLINSKLSTFIKTNIGNYIDYLEKGKRFYVIFTWLFAIGICAFTYVSITLTTSIVVALAMMPWIWMAGILLVTWILTRYVKRRGPNRGFGMIFDPVHRLIGKLIYRPFLKKMTQDPTNPVYVQMMKAKQGEGAKAQELYKESLRIILLDHQQLEKELRR